jgi:putative transposase
VWARLVEELAKDPDLEALFIDSTIVRAHQHATGALKKTARKPSGARGAG